MVFERLKRRISERRERIQKWKQLPPEIREQAKEWKEKKKHELEMKKLTRQYEKLRRKKEAELLRKKIAQMQGRPEGGGLRGWIKGIGEAAEKAEQGQLFQIGKTRDPLEVELGLGGGRARGFKDLDRLVGSGRKGNLDSMLGFGPRRGRKDDLERMLR